MTRKNLQTIYVHRKMYNRLMFTHIFICGYLLTLGWYGPRTSHPHNTNAVKRMRTQMENLITLGSACRITIKRTWINNKH